MEVKCWQCASILMVQAGAAWCSRCGTEIDPRTGRAFPGARGRPPLGSREEVSIPPLAAPDPPPVEEVVLGPRPSELLLAHRAVAVVKMVEGFEDLHTLRLLQRKEKEGQRRKTVLEAIRNRLKELKELQA